MDGHLDAQEAAERLGVSTPTVYAYVSRGLIRSESIPGTRRHRYRAADVEALAQRQKARREPEAAARGTLSFHGMPVLDSALTLIEGGRLYYRGHDALQLAQTWPLERVADLLWGAPFPDTEVLVAPSLPWSRLGALPPVSAFHSYLAAAAAADRGAYDLRAPAVRRAGARILRGLTAVAADVAPSSRPTADTLVEGWTISNPGATGLLQAALVLCADHELNSSAFTARCIASAAATPYMAVTGALAALQGKKHGGHTERIAELIEEGGEPADVLAATLRRDGALPGFGHPLYPQGDPRATLLLKLAPPSRERNRALRFVEAAADLTGDQPNLDFGLVTFTRALGLPRTAPFVLFALGRTVGWIAHALEQYDRDTLIRPRARYTGPWPDDGKAMSP